MLKNLHLTGGEPLLWEDVFEIIAAAKNGSASHFSQTSLGSAGMRLSSLGTHVFTSMEGAVKDTHEAIRGPGAWDMVMHGIRILREERVGFTLIFSSPAGEAGDFVRMAERLGAPPQYCFLSCLSEGLLTATDMLTRIPASRPYGWLVGLQMSWASGLLSDAYPSPV